MNDTKMYSLLHALTEVESAREQKLSSVTLRGIKPACAERVGELCSKKVRLDTFVNHQNNNQPCATFTFVTES